VSDAVKADAVSAAAKATTAPFRALAMLMKHPSLWPLAIVPCLIALLLLIGLGAAAWYSHGWLLEQIATPPTGEEWGVWHTIAGWLLWPALALLVLIGSALLAPAVCEPFLGAFARRVRYIATGVMPSPPSGRGISSTPQSTRRPGLDSRRRLCMGGSPAGP